MRLKFDGSLEHEKDMDCMNILVTGSSGQLGRALKELACGSRHRFVFTSPDACEDGLRVDITDRSSVMRAVSAGVDVISIARPILMWRPRKTTLVRLWT